MNWYAEFDINDDAFEVLVARSGFENPDLSDYVNALIINDLRKPVSEVDVVWTE